MKIYPIMYGEKIVGEACMRQEGMLWKISCTCSFESDEPLMVYASWSGGQCEIGKSAGKDEDFPLVKRISKHKLQQENLSFCISSAQKPAALLDETREIDDISQLRYSKLRREGKKLYLLLDQSSSRPTGQWSEPMISE